MHFPDSMFSQIVEFTLIIIRYLTDDTGRIDLDRFSQIEALSDLFYAILTTCGDCIYLSSIKFLWKSFATALATIEGENGDESIQTITTSDHHGPLRALTALDHPCFDYLRQLLDEAITGLHHLQCTSGVSSNTRSIG